jgi:uncharacterized membrane protein YGL010W
MYGAGMFWRKSIEVPNLASDSSREYTRGGREARSLSKIDKYMSQYDHEHTNPWNKVMHAIGIPLILVGIILAIFTFGRIGLVFFVGGWILLFAGHRIEGNKPAFFQGIVYFLVGPVWVAKEIKAVLLGTSRSSTSVP